MKTQQDVDVVMTRAREAFLRYKEVTGPERANFLRAIAEQIDQLGENLVLVAARETNLPEARLRNECLRTTNQLRSFARLVHDGDWKQASIDTGDVQRKPAAKPDVRKMLFPTGPAVVFGASNFPLAFSTAGGDTASALAAGCSVVVKSHPAHPRTAFMIAHAIARAIKLCRMPDDVFQHAGDCTLEAGQLLVQHPYTKSVAFTGSYKGGKALFDIACRRDEPIPVFAEMGSVNPIVVFPQAMELKPALPAVLASSIVLGVGQFCTNPGLIVIQDSPSAEKFIHELSSAIAQAVPAKMLHPGIAMQYEEKKNRSVNQQGVHMLTSKPAHDGLDGAPALALVEAENFIANPVLHEEVFGPYSLVVKCRHIHELTQVIGSLPGQLTCSVFGSDQELEIFGETIDLLHQRCGRIIFNGVPTGVEVCKSMQHGGPFPASTDSRFTSVGTDAIYRFVRPVCYQDWPDHLLPDELKDENPLNILRCVNDQWTREGISMMKSSV